MFSSYNQSLNNLIYSQRFYYNNYEYYNDYEKIQHKYKDDLSKVFFRLNRKSKGTIFYQWTSDIPAPKQNQSNQRSISMMDVESNSDRMSENKKFHLNQKQKRKKELGIQKMLSEVLEIFHQQNYSDIKPDEQSQKQQYQFINLKYINQFCPQSLNHNLEQQLSVYENNSISILNQILKKQSQEKNLYYEAIEKMNSFAKDDDQIFLERWNAFQNFGYYYLDHKLIKKQTAKNYKEQLKKLYEFSKKVRFIVERTLAAQYFNSLFLNLPNLKKMNRMFHPLTLGLTYTNKFFEQKNGFKQKPKVVFLNLDGRETPYNLRYARNMGDNFLYISVFKQPSHYYKKNMKMQEQFESDYDTNFANISDCYARMLINQAYPRSQLFTGNEQKFANKSRMLLFPLNNDYLRKQYYKNLINQKSNFSSSPKVFPTLETSADIYFLFQTIIFEEIRSFNPSLIIVSYNGYLNIQENHWNEIIKTLTVISDHRLTLFMNFIDRLGGKNSQKGNYQQQDQQQEQDEQQQEQQQEENGEQSSEQQQLENQQQEDDLDEFKIKNIQVITQFISKYTPFKSFWSHLEHERIITNLLMFLKVSSGVYSMQAKHLLSPHLKYYIGDRYCYLQCLGQSKQLSSNMSKFIPKMLKSQQLKELYNNQGKIQLKQNRKQTESYEKLIDSVILEFLNDQNRKQRFGNNYKLFYRLQEVLEEQEYQNFLKYGSQEDQNPEYSATFSNNSMSLQNRQLTIMHEYLKQMKKKILLQNLQTYRYRKVYYHDEDSDAIHPQSSSGQKIKCYKFFLYQDDSEQISFQKYSQVIFDSKRSKVYILNYRSIDQRHLILYGNLAPSTFDKKFSIKVQIAKQSQRQLQAPIYSFFDTNKQMFYSNLQNGNEQLSSMSTEQQLPLLKKDLVFVNYSHCFVKNKLYLYWPQKWSIRDQIKHKLLGLKYSPENVNLVVRVQWNSDNQCIYETLQLKENEKVFVNPRIGCSSYQIPSQNDDQFFVFGGIQDNQNDFFDIGQGMYQMTIKQNSEYFAVKPLPKIKQKNIKQTSISVMSIMRKNVSFATRLKPKMFYRIEKLIQNNPNSEENKLIISGGYGRQFTNFFNCFSYESYIFSISTKLIDSREIHSRRLIKLPKSIEINRVGKFYMINNSQNIQEVEQNFSDLPKDLFAYQFRSQRPSNQNSGSMNAREGRQTMMSVESSNSGVIGSSNFIAKYSQNRQISSFLDERFRTAQFKFDGKKVYLFGFNRTIRQKIYTKFWSPQLYIVDGNQSNIVHISLKTEKNFQYNISNFLMPRQQDIVSLCLDEDKLYVLSSSPVIHSIQQSNNKYVLYEGNLSNMTDVVNKHQLQMYEKFQFKRQKENMLKYKTLYAFDQKIYLFGGLATVQDPSISTLTHQQSMENQTKGSSKVSYREDYIIQKQKSKFVLKIRKVQSTKDSVQMISPAIVKFNELLYFYSIQLTQTIVKGQGPFPQIKQNYKLKIEQFNSESSGQGKCTSQIMKFYAYEPNKKDIIRIIPRLHEAKFVSITKHEPFNMSKLKEHLEKAAIRLHKRLSQSQLKEQKLSQFSEKCILMLKQRNQEHLVQFLISESNFFKDIIDCIKPYINEKQRNFEEEEMIKDLKICYSIVNKLILQKLIQKATLQEHNRQQTMSNQDLNLQGGNYQNSTSNMSNENIKREKLVEKLERLTLNAQQIMTEYRFIVEDSRSSRKIRYIAIGPLDSVEELRFFRIRFKHDVSLCLNKTNEQGFYFHPTVNSCQQIDLNDKFVQYDTMEQEQIKNESKSYKDYKLYCQLKI